MPTFHYLFACSFQSVRINSSGWRWTMANGITALFMLSLPLFLSLLHTHRDAQMKAVHPSQYSHCLLHTNNCNWELFFLSAPFGERLHRRCQGRLHHFELLWRHQYQGSCLHFLEFWSPQDQMALTVSARFHVHVCLFVMRLRWSPWLRDKRHWCLRNNYDQFKSFSLIRHLIHCRSRVYTLDRTPVCCRANTERQTDLE